MLFRYRRLFNVGNCGPCGAQGSRRRRSPESLSEFSVPLLPNTEDPELRRRSHVGLNKGEQQNALRRAVFFNRLGEIRDRSYENQRHRASGLNLLVAAIILWNTTYLQRAVDHLRIQGHHPASGDLAHLSPLGWEHINLTGDYRWDTSPTLFRPSAPMHMTSPQPRSVL